MPFVGCSRVVAARVRKLQLSQSTDGNERVVTRRSLLRSAGLCAAYATYRPLAGFAFQRKSAAVKIFDVQKYGAAGDGKTLDTPAIQKAIDEASAFAGKAQVLVRGGKKYLVG